jgi:hypothetical protein
MTRIESKMLTLSAVILIYMVIVVGLLIYAGPDMLSMFALR